MENTVFQAGLLDWMWPKASRSPGSVARGTRRGTKTAKAHTAPKYERDLCRRRDLRGSSAPLQKNAAAA